MRKSIYKTVAALLCAMLCAAFSLGCGGDNKKSETIEAKYTLHSAMLNGSNVTGRFQSYTAAFTASGDVRVVIGYLGSITTRNARYTFDGTTVRETYQNQTYTYTADGDMLRTTMQDFDDTIEIVLKKEAAGPQVQEVDFEGILFGDDISACKVFNYCPAIIQEKDADGREVMHIWFCTNKDDGLIMDHIGYRKGIKQDNGKWVFGDLQIVLEPTAGTWDARHTCDPAVIQGEFRLQGEQYSYLMAYLGCVTEDYSNNETGIAVAKEPQGPWVKVDALNPIVPWADECASGQWGTGMPTLMSIDGKGEVLLTFQSSVRGTGVQRWDFSDLDVPELQAEFTVSLTHNGIVNSAGQKCNVNIPDFAFDAQAERLYVFGVTNEKNPPDVTTTRVNSHCVLAYIDHVKNMEEVCTVLQGGKYTWQVVGYVGPNDTGFERNHNPGIVRDPYGRIPDSAKIGVIVTTGRNSWDNDNIFTYRLHGAYFDIT
ncbi:MAG: hypothetical protein HFE46_08750 [Clostridia bacterium]|jgi:hypothetical protein|nr:hypothetical protein [Clostridia bacterium]